MVFEEFFEKNRFALVSVFIASFSLFCAAAYPEYGKFWTYCFLIALYFANFKLLRSVQAGLAILEAFFVVLTLSLIATIGSFMMADWFGNPIEEEPKTIVKLILITTFAVWIIAVSRIAIKLLFSDFLRHEKGKNLVWYFKNQAQLDIVYDLIVLTFIGAFVGMKLLEKSIFM